MSDALELTLRAAEQLLVGSVTQVIEYEAKRGEELTEL